MSPTNWEYDLQETAGVARFHGLWRMLTGYRPVYAGATLALGLATLAQTAFFYLLRYFTDEVLGVATRQWMLPWLALGFVGLALFQGGFTFLSGRWAAAAAEGATRRLRDYLYDHIQRLTFTYHDKTPTGELIQRATSDVDAIRRFFAEEAVGVGRILLLFIVNVSAIFVLSPRLALVSLTIVPFIVALSLFFFRLIFDRYESFQEQEAKLSTTLQESLTGIRVVRAFARQQFEEAKFDDDNQEKFVRGRRLLMLHAVYWPLTGALAGGQLALGFWVASNMVIADELSLGSLLAYMGLLGWVVQPIRQIGRLVMQMSMGLVSFNRVVAIIEQEREPLTTGRHQPTTPLRGELVFENVSFAYEPGQPVLRDISFRCEPGQRIALIGGTGSGKSSLIGLLPRFYDYEGSIKLDGVELRDYPRRYLRRQIGLVHQEPFLFTRTIGDNIAYGIVGVAPEKAVSDEAIQDAARAAAVHEVITTFPHGYKTLVGEKGVTLSGGQKQRVALARTLLQDPRILILDDATSSVDTETEAAIQAALNVLLPGRTTFVIAHRVQTVMAADLILVLEDGRIVQRGTHAELMKEAGPYHRIYQLQVQIEVELAAEVAVADGQPPAASRPLPQQGDGVTTVPATAEGHSLSRPPLRRDEEDGHE